MGTVDDSEISRPHLAGTGVQVLLLFAILVFAFPGVFLRGRTLVPGDLVFDDAPWKHYAPAEFRQPRNPLLLEPLILFHKFYYVSNLALDGGEWPLWNPFEMGGLPLLANAQSAVFYPPRLLHRFLDVPWATTVFILGKFFLCGLTAYVSGRLLKIGRAASRVFSIGWMLWGYNQVWCYWSQADVTPWIPLLFAGIELLLDAQWRRGGAILFVAGTLALLAGHPETAFIAGAYCALYGVLRLVLGRCSTGIWLRFFGVLCASGCAILLVTSMQVLPTLEYIGLSAQAAARSANPTECRTGLSPGALLGLFAPGFWSTPEGNRVLILWVYWFFPGVLTWLGASLLLSRETRAANRTHRYVLLLCMSVFCLLLTVDAPGVRFINRLPGLVLIWFRYHAMFPMLAIHLLGAYGFSEWWRLPRERRPLAVPLFACATGACAITAFYLYRRIAVHDPDLTPGFAALAAGLFVPLLVGAFALFFSRRRPGSLIPEGLVCVALAAELIWAFRGFHPEVPRNQVFPETKLTEKLEALPKPCRIFGGGAMSHPSLLVSYGIEIFEGHDGIFPKDTQLRLAQDADIWTRMQPVCAAEYSLLQPDPLPSEIAPYVEDLGVVDGLRVVRNKTALPRAFLVPRLETLPSEAMWQRMGERTCDPARVALTDASPPGQFAGSDLANPGTARVDRRTTTSVSVGVSATAPAVLVLADTYYPGWTARIDGIKTPIFPVYGVYRGVIVAAGSHRVEYRFEPLSFRLGLAVSVATFSIGILAATGYLFRVRSFARLIRRNGRSES